MKKSILQFSVIAAIAASMTLTTSCSSDEDTFVPEPIQFSVGFESMAVTRAGATDTGNNWDLVSVGNTWEENDLVSIKTTNADGNTYVFEYKVAAGSGAKALTPNLSAADKQFYWKSSGESKTVEAWSLGTTSSAGTTQPDGQDFFVLANQSGVSAYNQELLYAYNQTISQSSSTNNINLYHQMALVTVDIISAENKVTAMTFGSSTNNIPLNGKFTAPTSTNYGSWAEATTPSNGVITARYIGKSDNSSADASFPQKTTYEAVLIPVSYNNKNDFFYISYDGAVYAYKGVAADDLKAGKHYTYTVKITTQGITTTATVQNWDTVTKDPVDAVLQ